MKLRPLATFVAGVVFATGVIGTTAWLRAADDNVITACANKKTGTMRYLTKGSCKKKTETQITWNQTGVTGAAGAKGDSGAKGDTGAKGTSYHVVDAAGRDFGPLLGVLQAGQAMVQVDGLVWLLQNYRDGNSTGVIQGDLNTSGYFADSSCTTPLWESAGLEMVSPTAGGVKMYGSSNVFVKAKGTPYNGNALNVAYRRTGAISNGLRACEVDAEEAWKNEWFVEVEAIQGFSFTAPWTLVEQ